ncbi:MAG: vitamin B12 dependent-methionine synthase activation domain-containing protein, partial [Xanthobacteraceae bacterium]
EKADIVGLSGLITPSLDEMCHVAAEFERNGLDIPVLIGGATTSRVHTAVKIHPNYRRGQVVHVNDASRAVGVASALMSREKRPAYVADVKAEYARVAAAHDRAEQGKSRLSLQAARLNALWIDWDSYAPPRPSFLGARPIPDFALGDLVDFIDWTPFFSTWELAGRFPAILDDAKVGSAARALYSDARKMLSRIVEEQWFRAAGAVGFWPANRVGDDIQVYRDEARKEPIAVLHTLRQQLVRNNDRPNLALADFVGPRGVADYVGAFIVTAGIGEDAIADRFKQHNDDYSSILVKALADRLAEAFAERLHWETRLMLWGYAKGEALTNEEIIAERYQGIRPAPGYPAQPDHTEKATVFELLGAADGKLGVKLTESFAMWPGAAVSGLYFSHPDSSYFGVGKVERDQVADYARRKGWTVAEAERWLAPVLNYVPERAVASVAA